MSSSNLDGKKVLGWDKWLRSSGMGCCHSHIADDGPYAYFICMGWHDTGTIDADPDRWIDGGFGIAWKIGRQSRQSAMQCDFDVDFEMPYDLVTGDVDDTLEMVESRRITSKNLAIDKWTRPSGYKDWNALASRMLDTAKRVLKDWTGKEK